MLLKCQIYNLCHLSVNNGYLKNEDPADPADLTYLINVYITILGTLNGQSYANTRSSMNTITAIIKFI